MPKLKLEPNMVKKRDRYFYRLPRPKGAPERTRPLGNDFHSARDEARALNRDRAKLIGMPTIEEYATDTWLKGRVALKRNEKGRKLAAQRLTDHIAPLVGGTLVSMLTEDDADRFSVALARKGLSPRTVHHILSDLRGIMRNAERAGLIDRCPVRGEDFPKVQRGVPRPFSNDELHAIFRSGKVPEKFHARMLVSLFTGARYGELRALEWVDVDLGTHPSVLIWQSHEARQTKGKEPRRVPLFPEAVVLFKSLPRASRHVFVGRHCEMIESSPDGPDRALKAVGPDANFHRFRHTFATRCRRAGMSWEDLQHVLGHADIRTTMQYALVEDGYVADRARALDLDWFGTAMGSIGEQMGNADEEVVAAPLELVR